MCQYFQNCKYNHYKLIIYLYLYIFFFYIILYLLIYIVLGNGTMEYIHYIIKLV